MTPDEFRLLNGLLALGATIALIDNIHWQIRSGLYDTQRWSAFTFLVSLVLLIGQVALALVGGPALSVGPRGTFTWVFFCVAAMGWNFHTRRHNHRVEKKRREREL